MFEVGDTVEAILHDSWQEYRPGVIIEKIYHRDMYLVRFQDSGSGHCRSSELKLIKKKPFEIKDLVVLDVPGSPEMKIKKVWNTFDGVEGYWCQWFTTTFEYREKWFPASIMRKL